MKQIRLGGTGLQVSELCLGMMGFGDPNWRPWILDEQQSRPFVKKAVESGITFFDTADVYSLGVSEEVTGKLLREMFSNRDDYVIASKVFGRMGSGANQAGLSRSHIMDAVDASLERLGVDHIDLYQIHRFDPETPIEETMEALHDCVRSGKVRYLGSSTMETWRFALMQECARAHNWTPFVCMQNNLNLLYREEEREMLPYCDDQDIGVITWSPLARGRLSRPANEARVSSSGRQDALLDEATEAHDRKVLDAVGEVAQEVGRSRAQVALRWVMEKHEVTAPILGVTKMKHLEESLETVDFTLTEEQIQRLEAPYKPRAWHIYA